MTEPHNARPHAEGQLHDVKIADFGLSKAVLFQLPFSLPVLMAGFFWKSGWFQQKTRENDCVEQDIFGGGTVNSHTCTLPEGCGFEVNIS